MEAKEMIELFKKTGKRMKITIRTEDGKQYENTIHFSSNPSCIYFYAYPYNGYGTHYYDRLTIDYNDDSFTSFFSRIIRIEALMEEEYYPIWTKEEGMITQTEHFVRLKGRYYTIAFLEQLIDKIIDFKEISL